MPNSLEIVSKEQQYVLGTYPRSPFVIDRGEGMTVYDTEGNAYLDFASGIAVTTLGHSDPEIVAAVQEQITQLSHVCNLYHTAPHAELAESLCQKSFADKVFFCNSGAEAMEAALKFARKYAHTVHHPGKTEFIAFTGGFHGRTFGALAITSREKYQAPFRPLMPGAVFAPFNDVDALKQIIGPQTCAVVVEPVQGEGGITLATHEFITALRALCDRYGALLIVDEIQCGLGRTGRLWGYEHFDIQPDIMTLAKALGGSLPMGATLMTDAVAATISKGDHGSTFAAGPVISRAAQVVLKRVSQPEMLEHVNAMSDLLVKRLGELPSTHIQHIRALGLMVGIEMDIDTWPIVEAGYEQGVLLLNAGPKVLRLLPPLIVTERDIDQLIQILSYIIE